MDSDSKLPTENVETALDVLMYRHIATGDIRVDGWDMFAGDEYWINEQGKLHRVAGPAWTTAFGLKLWMFNGEQHRKDGPAIEYSNGDGEWWEHGKHIRSKFTGTNENGPRSAGISP